MTNKKNKVKTFLQEVRTEMKKVNWPTKDETIKYTVVVLVATFIVSIYLGALDAVFFYLLDNFLI